MAALIMPTLVDVFGAKDLTQIINECIFKRAEKPVSLILLHPRLYSGNSLRRNLTYSLGWARQVNSGLGLQTRSFLWGSQKRGHDRY